MRFILAALLLVPALAHADATRRAPAAPAAKTAGSDHRTPDARQMKSDDCARARKQHKTCVLDMGGEDITGNGVKGNGERVDVLTLGPQTSLVRVRHDFIVEILRSAEDL